MATKRGPGAHVLARKGTYEKAEGQLEMSFRPPKEEMMLAAYGGRPDWGRSFFHEYASDFMAVLRHESLQNAVSGRMTFPMPPQQIERMTATEVSRRERDWQRGIQMVDFRGRVYPELTEAYFAGRRFDTIIADDVFIS
ncbi:MULTISPECIES: hypothetical protein [unclassified Mesorhizobium]|uniref:hypothetical protein n=1 Tax=unclassified Mesorhizobium TaxID=325217 RepID=UPI000FCC2B65|nr:MULTISPECIES: hypothetical protein [unclassified Mesorhizobium]RUT88034.1 hypothetical protein EOD14_08355 [Mesorhizobium sp. M7A.T.Ca.US.000.02.1.1]RUT90709.1 hypothetical protein EOD15_17710 [Mesorhizobium sp. M7A.T.Ca.US.000.02.2.1]